MKNLRPLLLLVFAYICGEETFGQTGGLPPSTGEERGEIERVCAAYPHLQDDRFVTRHRAAWMHGR